jgi:hypothetical protein
MTLDMTLHRDVVLSDVLRVHGSEKRVSFSLPDRSTARRTESSASGAHRIAIGCQKEKHMSPADAGVDRNRIYPVTDFMKVTGMGRSAFREACRKGLVSRRIGKRLFILGEDFLRFAMDSTASVKQGG